MYIYLGDGLQSTDRIEPFPVRRKRAAEAYLRGLKEALLCGAPLERPEYVLPPMPSGEGGMRTFGEGLPGHTVPGGMVSFEEGKRLSELVGDQAAKGAEVRRLQELHLCRWALFTQLIDMYGRREPHAASELRQMATEIVGDQEVIASLMEQLEERGALKDDLVEPPPRATQIPESVEPPGWGRVLLIVIPLLAAMVAVAIHLLRRMRGGAE